MCFNCRHYPLPLPLSTSPISSPFCVQTEVRAALLPPLPLPQPPPMLLRFAARILFIYLFIYAIFCIFCSEIIAQNCCTTNVAACSSAAAASIICNAFGAWHSDVGSECRQRAAIRRQRLPIAKVSVRALSVPKTSLAAEEEEASREGSGERGEWGQRS